MRNTFIRLLLIALISSFPLIQPTPVQAATFSLPPQLSYDGLTFHAAFFDRPIPVTLPTKPTSISFLTTATITFTPLSPSKPLVESITTHPTKTLLKAHNDEYSIQEQPESPTPTLYMHPTSVTGNKATTPTLSPLPPSPATQQKQPLPTTIPTALPVTATTIPNPGGLNADTLFSMANSYRQSKGLSPLEKDDRSCTLAQSRAPEINTEIAENRMHSGLKARNLPYWNTENIISMNSEQAAFNWWINDTIHREAIEGNYKYSCVACSGYACAQEFTNFQAK